MATPSDAQAFPMPRTCPFDPPTEYARLRAEQPISRVTLRDGKQAWLVSRYEDIRAVLADPRVSVRPRPGNVNSGPRPGAFIDMDPPNHGMLRRMVSREFAVKRVEAMRPAIQRIVDDLVDAVLAGPQPVDMVEAVALPLASFTICVLIGVPVEDRGFFEGRGRVMGTLSFSPEERQAAFTDVQGYLRRLVTTRERDPGDDLLSRLTVGEVRRGVLTRDEVAGMATTLLIAGHLTTASMTAYGILALLQHPEQFAELRMDPSLVPNAVEELLRYLTIIDTTRRTAIEDMRVGDQIVRAGEGIVCLMSSANRDESVFPDADTLDIHRPAQNQVAFGQGIHLCIGAPLARLELQVAYATITRRIPTLRLAIPLEEVPFKQDTAEQGVHRLPVAW